MTSFHQAGQVPLVEESIFDSRESRGPTATVHSILSDTPRGGESSLGLHRTVSLHYHRPDQRVEILREQGVEPIKVG